MTLRHERSHVGRRVARVEDERLLLGRGIYAADLEFADLAHMAVVRSDHPSATIRAIATQAAAASPGVLGVWTGADLAAAGLGHIPWEDWPPLGTGHATPPRPGDPAVAVPQPVLACTEVRYQGEPVAVVVAATLEQARDAAERVVVDYAPRKAVIDAGAASAPGVNLVWPQFRDNCCFEIRRGDQARTHAAFAAAVRIVDLHVDVPRLVQTPIEPRNYVGCWNASDESYTLYAAAGKPQAVARTIARDILRIPRERIRVIARDVGGGFGAKNVLYPEQVLVLWAARRVGRPVRWQGTRSECFVSDVQGRDQSGHIELALGADARILAMRANVRSNLGAYLSPKGAIPAMIMSRILTSVYDIPATDVTVQAVYTNTPPTGPYRGAGTPEAIFMVERIMETAARAAGVPSAEFRRRHLIPATAMPFTTVLGVTYDSGDFHAAMTAAEQAADVAGFARRREESARRGKLRGLGYANMIEWAGVGPAERASVSCSEDGTIVLRIGTMSNGQSHQTVYAQLLADVLEIDMSRVVVVQGDCLETPDGLGTGASRSMTVSGSAVLMAAERLVEAGRAFAADMLEASSTDVVYGAGTYRIAGTDRSVRLADIAARAGDAGGDPRRAFSADARYAPVDSTCPNGCHIAEVEVDPDTGTVAVVAYTIAQDVGRVLNPMVVEGQLAGGVTQGIGQALLEQAVFDPETGQLVAGSLMDYALPRADHVPAFNVTLLEVPCAHTPLGMKSCGEIGATGGPITTLNAVHDALSSLGVREIPMPATPQRVLRAIATARRPTGNA